MTPGQPDRTTLDAMVAFIKARLVKTAFLQPGEAVLALSETAVRFNETSWFWTDDNAKAAELLCEPGCYDADPAPADAAVDFVLRMSEGAIIQRRGGPAELRVLATDPAAFRVETAFFIVEGDLTRGVVRHALRFNDGRTVTAAQHTGNMVSFRHAGQAITLDVEGAISDYAVQVHERAVTVTHTSSLQPRRRWGRRPAPVLGALTYAYSISADRPSVTLQVSLVPAPGVTLQDVVLTTALDQLSAVPGVDYRALAVRAGQDNRFVRGVADKQGVLHSGPADYSAVVQEGASPGFSYAIHALLLDGAKLGDIMARGHKRGRLHWLFHRYAMGAATAEAPAVLREERMLTGGGYYDALEHYAAVMAAAAGAGSADPSMTYDIGAELNAVATHVLFARTGQYAAPPGQARLDRLVAWYDRHVTRYFDFIRVGAADDLDRVFTRGIAFAVLSLDCMLRATGEARYRVMMETGVGLILRMQRRTERGRDTHDVTFGDTWAAGTPFLDNHAACILALARAAWHGDPGGALGRAIHEGILGVRLYTGTVPLNPGHQEAYDGLAVLDLPERGHHADTGFWNFKLGVLLRALHATRHAAEAGVIGMGGEERQRLQMRLEIAGRLLLASHRWHDGMLEVLTSRISGETNSETQPWVALGVVPVLDERVVRLDGV